MALLAYAPPLYAFGGLDADTPLLDEVPPYHPIVPRCIARTQPAWLVCVGALLAEWLDIRFRGIELGCRHVEMIPEYLPTQTPTLLRTQHGWPPYGLFPDEPRTPDQVSTQAGVNF